MSSSAASAQDSPEPPLNEGYDRLLTLLHEDPSRAGEELDRLRQRLVRMFGWRGARFPEDIADETLQRVARQLASGTRIRADDPFKYICGVAFLVFKETVRQEKKEWEAQSQLQHQPLHSQRDSWQETRLSCLDDCLANLDEDKKSLVIDYYRGDKGEKISNRRTLAEQLGIKPVTLRLRALRLREKLEDCISQCLRSAHHG